MLRALAADAVFIAALFVEALASLSLLQSTQAITLARGVRAHAGLLSR